MEQLQYARTYPQDFHPPHSFWIYPCGCICFIPSHPLHAQAINDPRDCIPILRVVEVIFLGNSSMSHECLGSEWIVSELPYMQGTPVTYTQSLSHGSVLFLLDGSDCSVLQNGVLLLSFRMRVYCCLLSTCLMSPKQLLCTNMVKCINTHATGIVSYSWVCSHLDLHVEVRC